MGGKLRVAVIGAGRMGKIHTTNLCRNISGAEVVGIADKKLSEISQWAKDLGITNLTSDPLEVINSDQVDAVAICSSTDTHADLIIAAAKAGKDIFCEKPISNEIEYTIQALQAVKEAGVKLQVGFNRRFDPNFKRLKELVESGQLGEIHIVKITSRDPAPPPIEFVKTSGGFFLDMMIHDFDMGRYLINSEVTEVFASGEVLVDPQIGEVGDYDTTVAMVKFANKASCLIDNSREAVYGYDQRVEVFGSNGQAVAYNKTPTNVELSTAQAVVKDKPLYWFLERYMDSFAEEMKDFVEAITNKTTPPVTGDDGLQSLLVALAANKSAKENRPVSLDEMN